MKKVKYLFLREVLVQEHTETVNNEVIITNSEGQEEVSDFLGWYDDYDSEEVQEQGQEIEDATGFSMNDYESSKEEHSTTKEVQVTNIDTFNKYNLGLQNSLTYKEARTSIEEHRAFIVAKRGNKRRNVEDIDTIYRTLPKMRIEDNKQSQRIGFIIAEDRSKKAKVKDVKENQKLYEKQFKKFKGIINDEFPIYRRKPFNYKKVGYLKLGESTNSSNLYVEVIKNRGIKWMLYIILIIALLIMFISTRNIDTSGWKFNPRNLTLYKTAEQVVNQDTDINFEFNSEPKIKDNKIYINLSSDKKEGVTYILKIYDSENNCVYESKEKKSGEGIEKIILNKKFKKGKHELLIVCETYKNKKYLGSVESEMQLIYKK